MKKILLLIIIFWVSSFGIFAEDANYDTAGSNMGVPNKICTITSEPCSIGSTQGRIGSGSWQMARYECCVSAHSGFTDFIASIYKYIFFISLVLGVLFMVILGIGISISGFKGGIKEAAQKQIVATLVGLIVLALIPWILKTVAPFIFQ